jgi:hypothetical protein
VKLTYKTLKEKIKEINKKDAKFYSNMFSKMTKPSAEESVSISASFTVKPQLTNVLLRRDLTPLFSG